MTLKDLFKIIQDRKKKMPQNSYVASLLKRGKNKICEKISEEAGEVVLAAREETKQRVIEEITDLWFHSLVLMVYLNINLKEILNELKKRRKK